MGSRFAGKNAVITGGASGIGLAIGTALADAGAHVTLADVDEPAVESAADAAGLAIDAHGNLVYVETNAIRRIVDAAA